MAKLTVISWRDIPAQVVIQKGRESARVQLSQRFQQAVDRAAMRAGKSSSSAYLEDWKRSAPERCADDGDILALAAARAAALEARYSDADLLELIRAHGLAAAPAEGSDEGGA